MKSKSAIKRSRIITIAIFLIPALLFFFGFLLLPVIQSIGMGFFNIKMFGGVAQYKFVGLKNFVEVSRDSVFITAAKNTLVWAFVSPFLEIGIGLVLAMILYNLGSRGRFFRIAWFAPVLMPAVVVGIIWSWVYNFEWGLLNAILRSLPVLKNLARPWLGDPETALGSLIAVSTWMFTGLNMIILLAGLAGIPEELYDAAKIDGASKVRQVQSIILPLLRPTILNLMVLCFVGKMKQFDLVWASTQGGPFWSTETVATYTVKRAFYWGTFDRGYPSAVVTLWSLLVFVIATVASFVFRSKDRLEF